MDKIAPGIILFTSELDVDIRRSVSAAILKLKLSGHVKEKDGKYIIRNKNGALSKLLKTYMEIAIATIELS